MPFVTITLPEGNNQQFIQSLSAIVQAAMVETIKCPPNSLYHRIQQVRRDELIYLPGYNNILRSENVIMFEITLKEGRTAEQKKQLYEAISSGLNKNLGIRYEDIIIVLTENKAEDWYFGRNA